MSDRFSPVKLERLLDQFPSRGRRFKSLQNEFAEQPREIPEAYRISTVKLLHNVAIRRHDARGLRLSSLGRMEVYS